MSSGPCAGVLKAIGQQILFDRKPGVSAVFVVQLLFPAFDDSRKFNRLFAFHFSGDEGALTDDPGDRILPRLLGDLLRDQGAITFEFHVNIQIDPLVSDFRRHAAHLASLRILTATP